MSGLQHGRKPGCLRRWHRVSRTVAPDLIGVLAVAAVVLTGLGVLDLEGPLELGAPFTLAAFLYRLREG